MRLIRGQVAAAATVIMPLDPHKTPFNEGVMMYGSSTVSATAQVDATISDIGAQIGVSVSQTTTVVTVTFPSITPHTLGGVKDYIVISGTGIATIDGIWPVASVTNDTVLTYTSTSASVSATAAVATPVRLYTTLIASASVSATTPAIPATSATTLNLPVTPFSAILLKCTSYSAGTVYCDTRQAGSL